ILLTGFSGFNKTNKILEREPQLRIDAAVVSGVTATKSAEPACRRGRLSKQQRAEVTDRIPEVRVIQNVVEVQRERQIVAATSATRSAETTAAAARSTTKTAAATSGTAARSATARSTTSHAAAHHRVLAALPLLIVLTILTLPVLR